MGAVAFGNWIRSKREEKGHRERRRVSVAEVARRADLSRQYVSQLEAAFNPATGKPADPDAEVVRRIARALDADEEEALRVAGKGPLAPRVKQAEDYMNRLTPAELDSVITLLETMTVGRVNGGAGRGREAFIPA